MGTEKDHARGTRQESWKTSAAFNRQSNMAVKSTPDEGLARIEPKNWLSERQRNPEEQSKAFRPISVKVSSLDAMEAYVFAMREPAPIDEANLKSKKPEKSKEATGEKSKASPVLVASKSSTPSGGNGKETKPLDPTQDKKKLAWASPLDLLDYLGLGVDVLERAYIEIGMKPGQEKEFARFSNTLFFTIDAAMAVLPGAGGGGLAVRASHEVGVAAWHALPASSKAKVIQELAKTMGWSATRTSQAVNVFFSMTAGKGGGKDGNNKRPADLPSSKKVKYDWDHIFEGHWEGTPAKTRGNNTVFWGLNKNQIKAVIKDAYKNIYKKVQTQGDKIRVRGKSGKWDIEMWVNKKTNKIETAYPKEIKK
jgi:hypothetical protein